MTIFARNKYALMKIINNLVLAVIGLSLSFFMLSCQKERVEPPVINFKTGALFLHANDTLPGDSVFTIGIEATKQGTNGELRIFNISKSVNDSALVTVYSKGLTGTNRDSYTYDFTTKADTIPGTKCKYLFTVTNLNDITKSISLTVVTE